MTGQRQPPPPRHTGRNVRGGSITCDECGDQLEIRAHGEGVRGEQAAEVAAQILASLRSVALALRWLITPLTGGGERHTCPSCRASAAARGIR